MIFGSHGGAIDKGPAYGTPGVGGKPNTMFCHLPENWKGLWEVYLRA